MIYISADNKVMMKNYCGYTEIIYDDKHIPLCVCANIILMSDGYLYRVCYDQLMNCKLFKIKLETGEKYLCEFDNFTSEFAKINSKYYEINGMILSEIPIIAKNSHNIMKTDNNMLYYYISTDDELILFNSNNKSRIIFDYGVNFLLLCRDYDGNKVNVIYEKNSTIICSVYDDVQLVKTYVVEHDKLRITKILKKFALDSNNNIHMLKFIDSRYHMFKNLNNIIDFNYCGNILCIVDSEQTIREFNIHTHTLKYVNDNGYFKKIITKAKSANKLR